MKYVINLLKEKIDSKEFGMKHYIISESEINATEKQIKELKKAIKILETKK